METTTIKALSSFAGKQGKFREGEVGKVTASYAKELIELGLAEETDEEPQDKSDKTADTRKTKPQRTPNKKKATDTVTTADVAGDADKKQPEKPVDATS